MTTFHWTDGNGALPFPGKRVESTREELGGTAYEIREYLGNETVVSYCQIYGPAIPARVAWADLEARFQHYVYMEVEHDRAHLPASQPGHVPGPEWPPSVVPGGGERPARLDWRRP